MLWHIVMLTLLFLSGLSMSIGEFYSSYYIMRNVFNALYLVMQLGVSLIMGWVMTKVNLKDKELVIEQSG